MGLADHEALYDPTSEGRRVPDSRHYEYHVPYRSRRFHPDWTALSGRRETKGEIRSFTETVCVGMMRVSAPPSRGAGLFAFEVSVALPAPASVTSAIFRQSSERWHGCACGLCRCVCA
jgi:hypothetical protein